MIKCFHYSVVFLLLLSLNSETGCNRITSLKSVAAYVQYINNPKNGLIQVQESSGLKFTVKYLPPAYLAYLEHKKENHNSLDSLAKEHKSNATFQVIIESVNPQVNLADLIHRRASSQADVNEHLNTLNYGMEKYVSLSGNWIPVLSTLESTLEMNQKLSFIFVFTKNSKENTASAEEQKTNLIIDSNFFLNSPVSFAFESGNLTNTPTLSL